MAFNAAVRRAETERVVTSALEESASWQEQRRLLEALSAARRAEGLLAGADVDEALRQRVRARLADLELLDRLENIRLEQLTATKDGNFDVQGGDALYGQTFRDAGLDVEALPAEEAGQRIAASSVAAELAVVLDQWASTRWGNPADSSWQHLLRVARVADPDVWRTRVREALERRDWQALLSLASSEEIFDLAPATLFVLGNAVQPEKESRTQVEVFLRKAQRRHPNDFWLNHNLWAFFGNMQPPQTEEALRFATVVAAIRPASPGAHYNLAIALNARGQRDEAIAEYREAIRIKKDYAQAHQGLGIALRHKGLVDEAIAEYREAIHIKKDYAKAHYNLAIALNARGQRDEAIAACREAIHIKKDYPEAHCNLGDALYHQGDLEGAIAEYRAAIATKQDFPQAYNAHNGLGNVFGDRGRFDDAITAYRKAIWIKPEFAEAHYGLGHALRLKGLINEAIAEYRQAIRIKEDFAEAHCNLGHALQEKGQLRKSVEELQRGHELGSRNPRWPYPSAQWLRQAQQLAQLDDRLSAILEGKDQPKDAAERLGFAKLCQKHYRQQYAAAARFYQQAFDAERKLAEDVRAGYRYDAACAAALAGCGQGRDADKVSANERVRLRRQALDWLRADLDAWRGLLNKQPDKIRPVIDWQMRHWQADTDFAGVRGPEALAKLPETERQPWQKLWNDVADMLKRAQGRAAAEKK
jgi:tetratricopeptide (TPR) repeat protein